MFEGIKKQFDENDQNEKPAFVIEYDPESGGFRWMFLGSIPIPPLIGTMELIKANLIDSQRTQMAQAAQSKLVMPNGPLPQFRK